MGEAAMNYQDSPRSVRRRALEAQICEQAAAINAAHAQLCELVAEHDREEFWSDSYGISSTSSWLSWSTGLMPSAARGLVSVARSLPSLPKLKESFASGKLSLGQVTAVTKIAEPLTDPDLTDVAEGLSAQQLSTFVTHYRAGLHADEDPGARRGLRMSGGELGLGRISGVVPNEQLYAIQDAIEAVARDLVLDDSAEDPWAARRLDALSLLAENTRAKDLQSRSGADSVLAVLHVDTGLLDGSKDDGVCYIEGSGGISKETAERLLCDAKVLEMEMGKKEVLDVGRARRSPTTAIRRALKARDTHCVWPGCGRTTWNQAHHVDHWVRDKGETKVDRMVMLCFGHHRMVHEGKVEMVADGKGGWSFIAPDGTVITKPSPRAASFGVHEQVEGSGVVIDATTCFPTWGGEPGNLRNAASHFLGQRDFDLRREARNKEVLDDQDIDPGHDPPSPQLE